MTRLKSERGAIAAFTTITLVVLMAGVALSVDVGGLLLRRREMVNAADAAALAAAVTYLEQGDTLGADAIALEQFKLNSPGSVHNSPGGITAADLEWVINDDGSGMVTVRYTTRQPLYFAPVLGFGPQHDVTSSATATWDGGSLGNGAIELECGGESNPCTPKNKVPLCHYNGSDIAGGSGNYISPPPSTTGSGGPAGHGEHDYDVVPGYWFKQNARTPAVYYEGINWPTLENLPASPVDYTWMIGMSAESFIAAGCVGEGPHVWLSN